MKEIYRFSAPGRTEISGNHTRKREKTAAGSGVLYSISRCLLKAGK